jgi:uncharacterized membrane protein YGL010W
MRFEPSARATRAGREHTTTGRPLKVIIVGAGTGGLCLAQGLRAGHRRDLDAHEPQSIEAREASLPARGGGRSVQPMRTVNEWLGEYGASHQNPINKILHWICVPPIVLAVMGLVWSLPVPGAFSGISALLNWATLVALAALVYYFALSPSLAVGLSIAFIVLLLITQGLARLPWPLWITSLTMFIVAWIGQFLGHALEGKRPSFFKDLQFLLIGPLWLLAAVYRKLSLPY